MTVGGVASSCDASVVVRLSKSCSWSFATSMDNFAPVSSARTQAGTAARPECNA